MPIIASDSGGGNYTPAPTGVHAAVCADVIDLGVVETTFEGKKTPKHMIRIVWEIGEEIEPGKPFTVSKRYNLSLHEKAGLRKDLESWRSRPFDETELKGFDVERLISVNALLNVVHAQRDGKTYANVSAIMPLPKAYTKIAVSSGYVRQKDRKKETDNPPVADLPPAPDASDDDAPAF